MICTEKNASINYFCLNLKKVKESQSKIKQGSTIDTGLTELGQISLLYDKNQIFKIWQS